ncbi:putative U6 snRNA-associated Sm-like protein LSm4 [Trichoplax sp. H2]|nr:putative U6 snRNA-associated Sm-like protein LSm4 [Trichoplax sp. H2]|eukprot:RDD41772.1 putative U6 snRNA-associated Sm-like protein LSm4 [Trichoplax sp. H2]
MLPLSLLKTAQSHPMLVELKNGETYNGHLVNCDNFMNINLREVICTSKDGDRFWKMPECYLRGNMIKYLRIPDEVIDMVKEEAINRNRGRGGGFGGRGRGGRGRGQFNRGGYGRGRGGGK